MNSINIDRKKVSLNQQKIYRRAIELYRDDLERALKEAMATGKNAEADPEGLRKSLFSFIAGRLQSEFTAEEREEILVGYMMDEVQAVSLKTLITIGSEPNPLEKFPQILANIDEHIAKIEQEMLAANYLCGRAG